MRRLCEGARGKLSFERDSRGTGKSVHHLMSVAGASSRAGQDWCQSSLSEEAVPLFNLEVMWESVFIGLDFDLIHLIRTSLCYYT